MRDLSKSSCKAGMFTEFSSAYSHQMRATKRTERGLGVLRILVLGVILFGAGGAAKADLYNYGAIAFDNSSGAYGYSYNQGSRPAAKAVALKNCRGKCEVKIEFWNACAALATNEKRDFGTAMGDKFGDKLNAQRRALEFCNQRGAGGCKIEQTVCNSVPIAPPEPSPLGGKSPAEQRCALHGMRPDVVGNCIPK